MRTNETRLHPVVLAAACAVLMAAVPARAQTPNPGVFVSPPEGSVTVYQRKSEGSYGVYNGPVRWVMGRQDWNGRMLVSSVSERHGIALLDPVSHGTVAQLASNGKPMYTFNPPLTYDWPLTVGKSWKVVAEMTTYQPPGVMPITVEYKVEALEDVTVPAGSFKAYKVVSVNSFGETEQVWTVPSIGLRTVKVIRDRAAMHPLGPGHQEGVLVSQEAPKQ